MPRNVRCKIGIEPLPVGSHSNMRGASMRTSAVGLISFAVFLALVGCKKPDATAAKSAPVEAPIRAQVAPVEERPMPEHIVMTGTLRANQESDVAADAAGKVTATFVERGQRVKQGDTLAILDARGASISATAAVAQSQLARAQLEQAQRECDRVKALKDSGAISQAEYDRTISQCQTTQWSLAAAQAQQQSAQKNVGDAIIRAPFAGIVGERSVSVGQYVLPSTRVVTLYAVDPLRVELTIPESFSASIRPEQSIVFTVSAFGDEKFNGTIRYVSPNIRAATRDLVVEAFCPNPDFKLKPGMFAVAHLDASDRPMLAVPRSAIVKQPEADRVFAVVNKRVEERIVQLGSERDGKVAVLVGVKPGESVVVSPGADVRDGAQVQ
jgi:RND family efflux transporter MFP subunit